MNLNLNIFQVAAIIAIFQSVLIAGYLFSNNKQLKLNNLILAILLSIYSLMITGSLLQTVGIGHLFLRQHKFIFLIRQGAFLIGPLVYFYIRSMSNPNLRFKIENIIHFLPFILAIGFYSIRIYSIEDFIIGKSNLRFFNNASMLSFNIGYLVWSLFRLKKINFSAPMVSTKNESMFWLKFLTGAFIFLWTIQFNTFLILDVSGQIQWCPYMISLYSVGVFMVFNSMILIILQKPMFLRRQQKYQTSSLSERKQADIKHKLVSYVEKQRAYLDPSISIKKISDELSIPARYISQVINESFHQSFSDYINGYRIQESKKLLIRNKNEKNNILQIAYEVGFNSKSSFNEVFKKHTGMSPTAYRENQCSQE